MNGLALAGWEERGERRDEVLLRTQATGEHGQPHVITIVNLSPGGLMARSDAALESGDALSVDLPTVGRVGLEVRWSLGGRIGCRFDRPVQAERYYPLLAAVRGR